MQSEAQLLPPSLSAAQGTMPGYYALHRSAGWIDLFNRTKIVLRGPDRVNLIDSLVSNNIRALQSGQSCYAFFLNQQGYVIADANIACLRREILIDAEPEVRSKLFRHLERNTISDQVQLEDVTDRVGALSVEGPAAPDVLLKAGFPAPAAPYEFLESSIGWIGRVNTTGQDGFVFLVPRVRRPELISQIEAAGAAPVSAEEARIVRVERGKPRYGDEITLECRAQETGLCHALNFGKRPYLGRGTIHGLRSHGHLNKILVGVEMECVRLPDASAGLSFAGRKFGELVSSVYSPSCGASVGLAYVSPAFARSGVELLSDDGVHVRIKSKIDTGIASCYCHN